MPPRWVATGRAECPDRGPDVSHKRVCTAMSIGGPETGGPEQYQQTYGGQGLFCPQCWNSVQPMDVECARCGYRPSVGPPPAASVPGPPPAPPVAGPPPVAPAPPPPAAPVAPPPPAAPVAGPPPVAPAPPPPPMAPAPPPMAPVSGPPPSLGLPDRSGPSANEWPFPEKNVAVAGRMLPVELVVVAGIYAFAGLWLLWAIRDLVGVLPDLVSGLFSDNSLEFVVAYVVFYLLTIILYTVAGFLGTAYLLLRVDPVGRGLSVVVTGVLFATLVSAEGEVPAWFVVVVV